LSGILDLLRMTERNGAASRITNIGRQRV